MLEKYGKYKIVSEIARGGMGIVYKGEDPDLQRFVAIKELFLEMVEDEQKDVYRERFRREAILAANLHHPNIVAIYDVSISNERAYYIMELLTGVNLRQELAKHPNKRMSAEEFLPILSQTCKGLAHAGDQNLVHRDIKPDNIFILPDGTVKITDFGIARSSDEKNSNLTKPGILLGTLSYISPEQAQDAHSVDQRADIYSLAVVTYEALTGQLPFEGDGLNSILLAIITREAKPANEVNSEVSQDVAAVIAKAMRKKPEDRYQTVLEYEKDFERAITMHRGSGLGMLRSSAGGSSGSYTPGIPVQGAGRVTGSFPRQSLGTSGQMPTVPAADDGGKPVIKPWLAGRSAEKAKSPASALNPNTTSTPLVKHVGKIGTAGDYAGSFVEPVAICVRGGKIVVADNGTRKFQIFNKEGKAQGESRCTAASKMGSKTNGGVFSRPSAVTIDNLGRIYAADGGDHFVRIFDPQGSFVREFQNKQGAAVAGGNGIGGLLVDDDMGYMYLSDTDNCCVQVVTSDVGAFVKKIGSKWTTGEHGQFQLPQGLALDSFGQLYVVDQTVCRISVFSNEGVFQRTWGFKGKGKGELMGPRGIAIDKYDRVYVADSMNHRIQIYSAAGDYLYNFGSWGTEPGRFMNPTDLSIEEEMLYVVDKGNCRVQIFALISD